MKALTASMALSIGLWFLAPSISSAQTYEDSVVEAAGQVLGEIMAIPVRQIPESMLSGAQGLAIIPNLVKGGFVVGVRHGRGVVVVRDASGVWKPPVFVSLTGGSFGWQIGLQATDVILVFKTRNSVDGLMRGKFTLGVDAAAAAGPVGREASAATDANLKAEIYSYSRSRGLFAGLALDGSALQIDSRANMAYYGGTGVPRDGTGSIAALPPSGKKLLETVARYARTGAAPTGPAMPNAAQTPTLAPQPPVVNDPQVVRRQLTAAARQLDPLLDDNWKKYLALPEEVHREGGRPTADALNQALVRYDNVARSPQYQALAQQAQFRAAYDLLKRYASLETQRASTLTLPPPPR